MARKSRDTEEEVAPLSGELAEDMLAEKLTRKPEPVVAESQPRPKRIPVISTKDPGKVNRTLEGLARLFKQNNPTMACRWVYSPEHKKELSNVVARKSEGYEKVKVSDLGEGIEDYIDGDDVRVGDVIMMKISQEEKEELVGELAARAEEQSQSVEAGFYENVADLGLQGSDGSVRRARPTGRAVVEERDHEYDVEQRTSEQGG